ncbi:MAG: hypothetical protein DMG10_16320 [Acidobacteria bacterium]|nr:MAG: hypothetical protein DMG10_16320 [Acidobacteriota bacterium]
MIPQPQEEPGERTDAEKDFATNSTNFLRPQTVYVVGERDVMQKLREPPARFRAIRVIRGQFFSGSLWRMTPFLPRGHGAKEKKALRA